ncbi:hypothetical protein Tsubulata_003044 [Turnera subulata]|uniref:Ubiquitin carboxyl-terminal hydrolase n=1 Tax=Turnera subulata TaxID=218843 RepID=A0A9Q0JHE8_9ROSI|nr:hypothetical protein Tsubulata_003044 [Turnera subulata]
MGKRVKKKSRAPQKEKRVVNQSPQQGNVDGEPVDGVPPVVRERKPCPHLEKSFDLNKLSEKIGSSDPIRCGDCREGGDRRGAKGKAKLMKKKTSGDLKGNAIWVCLACGHYACGGVGFPTTPQSHAVRHAKLTRHPLVVQWENPQLRWCFPCNMLIPGEKSEENGGDKKDVLLDVVKLFKAQSSERPSVDVEDVWFGGGSVTSEIKAEGTVLSVSDGGGGYMVRGLVNLGNTCFFNSVMQNLLAMDMLRDYFFNQDACFGPLSISLKKLFGETKPESGLKSVLNPKSFFGCICSKASQFRGYQQQDSHELLRCLLDGLSTEELAVKKRQVITSEEVGIHSNPSPTFVDAAFGGRISSTVCCRECGHTSTVYEPFLDLSLSVPMKKSPSKKIQPVARGKKPKLPPKRGVKPRPKYNKEDPVSAQCISTPSVCSESTCQIQPTVIPTETTVVASGDTPASDATGPPTTTDSSALSQTENPTQSTESFGDFWLDCLGTETISDEHDLASTNHDILASQQDRDAISNNGSVEASTSCAANADPSPLPDPSSVNPWEDEVPLQVQSSEVLLLPYKEESSGDRENAKEEAEASSSVVGGQDEGEFSGFGDLFNEPEEIAGPVAGPSLGNNFAFSSFMAGNNSESDPDEVDNSDSPVSVESCLAHFVKPELLSNDNAWECENCSRALHQQMLKAKKKAETVLESSLNGGKNQSQRDVPCLDKDISGFTEVRNLSNGDTCTDNFLNTSGPRLIADNERIDCSNGTCLKTSETGQVKQFDLQCEEREVKMDVAKLEQSHGAGHYESCSEGSLSGPAVDSFSGEESTSTDYVTAKGQLMDSQLTRNSESVVKQEDDKNIKKLNVKRDATKRVFIDKAPPVLTIHLKRFTQDARGRLSKLNGHVNFSEVLDLRSCMDPRCENREDHIYRLLGVVEHLGTMRGGHYVAYVRGGGRSKGKGEKGCESSVWYHASDAYVRQVSFEEVLRSEAYILFYERISN